VTRLALLALAATAAAGDLLVVAPAAFHGDLKAYVARKGAGAKLVALEQALAGEGADEPERLKRFLYDAWRNGTRYVLLVGDGDVLPMRYMALDRVTPAAFDTAFYPSDLYYADVAKQDGSFEDWNGQKEGFHALYFGEVRGEKNKSDPINFDGIDYLPELAVGRWPVSNVEELGRVVANSLAFDRGARTGRVALIDVPGWVDCTALHARLASSLGDGVLALRAPDEATLLAALGKGPDLVLHTGHGDVDRWHGCISVASLANLPKGVRPPVVFSAGCSTAAFAPLPPYEAYVDTDGVEHAGTNSGEVFSLPPPPPHPLQPKFDRTGLGEQFLLSGAAVYIGCNTGSQPCALTLMDGFARAYPKALRLGDCWLEALRHYHRAERLADLVPTESWYPPSVFFQGMKFMFFGDPSLAR